MVKRRRWRRGGGEEEEDWPSVSGDSWADSLEREERCLTAPSHIYLLNISCHLATTVSFVFHILCYRYNAYRKGIRKNIQYLLMLKNNNFCHLVIQRKNEKRTGQPNKERNFFRVTFSYRGGIFSHHKMGFYLGPKLI